MCWAPENGQVPGMFYYIISNYDIKVCSWYLILPYCFVLRSGGGWSSHTLGGVSLFSEFGKCLPQSASPGATHDPRTPYNSQTLHSHVHIGRCGLPTPFDLITRVFFPYQDLFTFNRPHRNISRDIVERTAIFRAS
jgi:hypothetical protein